MRSFRAAWQQLPRLCPSSSSPFAVIPRSAATKYGFLSRGFRAMDLSPCCNFSNHHRNPPLLPGVGASSPDKKPSAERPPLAAPFPRAFCSRRHRALPPAVIWPLLLSLHFGPHPEERSDEGPLSKRQLKRHSTTRRSFQGSGLPAPTKSRARSAHRSRRPSRDPLPFAFRCRPWDRHSPEWRF